MSEHKLRKEFEGLSTEEQDLLEEYIEMTAQALIDNVSETIYYAVEKIKNGDDPFIIEHQNNFEELNIGDNSITIRKEVTAVTFFKYFEQFLQDNYYDLFYKIDNAPNAKQLFEDIYNHICDYLLSIVHRESYEDFDIKLYFLNVQEVLVFKYTSSFW